MTPIHSRLADALARLNAITRSAEQQQAQVEGLSPLQARALDVVRREGPLRVGELAEALRVTHGTLSAAVSTLEAKELVRKRADPDEHRAVVVALTRAGRRLAGRAASWGADALEPAVEDLAQPDAGRVLEALLVLLRAAERRGLVSTTRMCLGCRHFREGRGRGGKAHFCALLDSSIGHDELQVDCADFALAGTDPHPAD